MIFSTFSVIVNSGLNNGKGENIPSFSINHMDRKIDPRKDFYHYASGNWIKNNPVPPSKSHWGSFEELRERNDHLLKEILEKCEKEYKGKEAGIEKMLGDFFRSAMDTEILEKLKFSPVENLIESMDDIQSHEDLVSKIIEMHASGISAFFNVESRADEKNTSVYALVLEQGGLTLPNRDYYLEDSFGEMRKHYTEHMIRMFTMFGMESVIASKNADIVLRLETEIAKASRTQTELRDAEKNYNRLENEELISRFSGLNPASYMKGMKIPAVKYAVVGQPEFFDFISGFISNKPLEELKIYLKWKVLHDAAPFLHSDAEKEHFDMFNRKLMGQSEPEPRWKRSVRVIDLCLGEALGKLYVQKHFGEESGKRMSIMVEDIKSVFRDRLAKLPWMSEETKKRALAKFERFRTKIGHPEEFRDYSSVHIDRTDYIGNVERSSVFEVRREMSRIGGKVDRNEWLMTPPTVNAYFSPPDNEIVFPAGILQPPFFDVNADVAVNYGGIGTVISHEITHGYDDQGRRYDENGNLNDWWNSEDAKNFQERAKEVISQYSEKEALPGLHVNGELTLGENIADFGGISIAYEALQRRLEKEPALRKEIDGFTPEQRFFIAWAQVWKENIREQLLRMLVSVDPHSPNKFRASIPVYNHPEFENAFPAGKGDVQENIIEDKISIW